MIIALFRKTRMKEDNLSRCLQSRDTNLAVNFVYLQYSLLQVVKNKVNYAQNEGYEIILFCLFKITALKFLFVLHFKSISLFLGFYNLFHNMQKNQQSQYQKLLFGAYKVSIKQPFKIVQAPFRKFSKYERDGHWNQKQRLKYTVFLRFFQDLLEDPERKKNARIYQMMSDMIITRNPNQCRSHHQKMQKYRETISDIIASVTEKYEPRVFREIQEKYLGLIKALLQNSDKYIRFTHQHQNKRINTGRFNFQRRLIYNEERQVQTNLVAPSGTVIQEDSQQRQVKQEKKALKKTAEEYSEEEDYNDQSYEGEFEKIPSEAKIEYFQNQGYIKTEGNAEQNLQLYSLTQKQIYKQNQLPYLQKAVDESLVLPIELALNDTSRMYYSNQLKQLSFQKRWHQQNAKHLMMQWNTQIESIRLCEQKIKFYRDSMSDNK